MPDAESGIVAAIVQDISGRKGLGDEWAMIDSKVRSEIIDRWREIVKKHLANPLADAGYGISIGPDSEV